MYFPHGFWHNSNLINGLIAFWTFNNSSDIGNDNFNGFDLSIDGSIVSVAGKLGNAAENTSDAAAYLEVSDANSKFNLTTDKTFCFWFKGANIEAGGSYFVGKEFSSPSSNYNTNYGNSELNFSITNDSEVGFLVTSPATLLNNTWYMATLRHYLSIKKFSLQINNNTPVENTYTGNTKNNNQNFRALELGAVGSTIDNLGVWNRVLSITESNILYNNGNGLALFS